MPIRHWPSYAVSAEKLVLLHGGSGSWLHWFKNIESLRVHFEVYALDLPGLGEADMFVGEYTALDAATTTETALSMLMLDQPYHIAAFSWGCTVTAMMMRSLSQTVKSVMLVGPAAVGDLPRRAQMAPLIKRAPGMSEVEVFSINKENLARLMIHDPLKIDDIAVHIQTLNTGMARFKSPPYARSTLVLDGVRGTTTPLYVIYGEFDAPAYPSINVREKVFRALRPDIRFDQVAAAGHWLQYEAPEVFNQRCINWVSSNR